MSMVTRTHTYTHTLSLQSLLWVTLYSLDLVSDHHGVLLADLGGRLGLVVIGTVVLIRVPVEATEQVPTATVKPCEADPLAAHEASVLLGFGGVSLPLLAAGGWGVQAGAGWTGLSHHRL